MSSQVRYCDLREPSQCEDTAGHDSTMRQKIVRQITGDGKVDFSKQGHKKDVVTKMRESIASNGSQLRSNRPRQTDGRVMGWEGGLTELSKGVDLSQLRSSRVGASEDTEDCSFKHHQSVSVSASSYPARGSLVFLAGTKFSFC